MKTSLRRLLLALAGATLALLQTDVSVDARAIQVALSRLSRSRDATLLLAATRANAAENTSVSHNDSLALPHHVDAVETRIFSGEGSHTIRVLVGGQTRELIIDTGSGKTAFICAGCKDCGTAHVNAPFTFTPQTMYLTCDLSDAPSTSPLALFSFAKPRGAAASHSTCMKCVGTKCAYSQTYVEGDYWVAYKVRDEMQLALNEPSFRADVDFGCIYEQNGVFNLQSSDGIMGFSKHPDSIFEQFYRRGVTKSRIFSQCLGAQGGMLTLGGVDLSINYGRVQYTPIRETGYQYWTVTLLSVEVGDAPLAIDNSVYNKDRGCVFDSGTTFLYMPEAVREPFKAAWRTAVGNEQYPISGSYYTLSALDVARFPRICFRFLNDATVCMSPSMYFFRNSPHRYAGTIFFGDGAKSTIIGASALTGYNVIYDVDNARIGVAEANCEASVSSDATAAMVELSLSPGGDTFRSATSVLGNVDVTTAVQWLLAAATVVGVAGLVNVLWSEARDRSDADGVEASAHKPKHTSFEPPARSTNRDDNDNVGQECDSDDSDDTPSAFAFILMHDDSDSIRGSSL